MSVSPVVRDAYSAKAQQYIDLTVGCWPDDEEDTALVQHHLVGLGGPVLDLGCGPGHWTARLQSWGADVTGLDLVPDFIAHAQATYPGTAFRLATMTELDVADSSAAGVLSWYSTIHLPPGELDSVLAEFRRVLVLGGVLVIGFFDSGNDLAEFDHQVVTAYRWPVDTFVEHLLAAGFIELERRQHRVPDRPDRRYAAVAARAVRADRTVECPRPQKPALCPVADRSTTTWPGEARFRVIESTVRGGDPRVGPDEPRA